MSDVSLFILSGIDRQLQVVGRSLVPLLEGTSVRPEDLRRIRPSRCSWDDFVHVLDALAVELGGLDALEQFCRGLNRAPPSMLSMLAKRYMRPHTLYYVGVSWYAPSLIKGIDARISDLPDGVIETLTLAPRLQPAQSVFRFFAGIMSATPTLMGWPPADVETKVDGQQAEFRIRIRSPEGVQPDPDAVARERRTAEADLVEFAAFQPESDSARPTPEPSAPLAAGPVSQRVRWLLERELARGSRTASEVARQLGMSERSLTRALAAEGTGFRALRDEVRRLQAIELLRSGVRIDEVARRLGFSDASAFHRAFRRWTGHPPGSFLAQP